MTDYVEDLCHSKGLRFDRRLERELPFRTQMRLQKFQKGLALLNGRCKVKRPDYQEFRQLFKFMNLRFNDLPDWELN